MTTEITKTDGEFTPQSKAAFQAFARSLADGCYILAAYDCAGAIAQIEQIAAWFNGANAIEQNDPAFLDKLLTKSNQLAYYLLRLSQELGGLYADKNAAELRRRVTYSAALKRLRKEANERKEKFVFSVAEMEAENEIADLRASEALADSLWQQTKIYHEAARDILQRMSQQISNLKSQREAYLRSDNSSFPT